MSAYCVRADLYRFGLPRDATPNPGRLATADASTNAITLDVHGFDADQAVTLSFDQGGELPTGLIAGTTYYVLPVSESSFKLAATAGGVGIDIAAAGTWFLVSVPIDFDAAIEFGAALIDQSLPAHCVPLVAPYPPIVVMTNAQLAIGQLLINSTAESISKLTDAALKRLDNWAKGQPIRGENAREQTPGNVAVPGPVTLTASTDSRGWGRYGGTRGGRCC